MSIGGAGAGHGTGGLLRRSTWLRPVPTFAALPIPALPGAAAITLDTNIAYEFNGVAWVPISGSGSSGFASYEDFFPTPGQTVFILATSPTNVSSIFMEVNHVTYYAPVSFTTGGPGNRTITWLNAFILDGLDTVRVYY